MTLAELKRLAQAAKKRIEARPHLVGARCDECEKPLHDALSPERVLALIACVEAADAMRKHISLDAMNCGDAWRLEAYDARRATLEDAK